MEDRLNKAREEALARIESAQDVEALRAVDRDYVGKGGVVAELLASIPNLPPAERGSVGKGANVLKREIVDGIAARKAALEAAEVEALRSGAGFDPTLPGAPVERGSLHPLTRVRREVEDIFLLMGPLYRRVERLSGASSQ